MRTGFKRQPDNFFLLSFTFFFIFFLLRSFFFCILQSGKLFAGLWNWFVGCLWGIYVEDAGL